MAQFIPRDEVEWRDIGYLQRPDGSWEYTLTLPEPLASWDVFAKWEVERVHSMRDHLQQGMRLFDVGAEHGWLSLVYASMVGPENMVLIEPTEEFWPNIQATWERNYPGTTPKAFYCGLLSDRTTHDNTGLDFDLWPVESGGHLIDRNKYQYIHQHTEGLPQITLDDLVSLSGVAPQALTIDVEGAELLVLQGGEETLCEHRPLCWVSIHPDLMARDYDTTPDALHEFMDDLGYVATHLATDHEQHWLFETGYHREVFE